MDNYIVFELNDLNKNVVRRLFGKIKSVDKIIPPTQTRIIGYVLHHDTVYQKDLEDVLDLRRATVSGVLQTMEKNGLIERRIAKEDTRIKRIIIKNKTKIIFEENFQSLLETEKILKTNISDQDLRTFLKVIHKMKENLGGKNDKIA